MKNIILMCVFVLLHVASAIAIKDEETVKIPIQAKLESVLERVTDLESIIAEKREVIDRQTEKIQKLEDWIVNSGKS